MCGIAGIVSNELVNTHDRVDVMLNEIQHRGPDGRGIFADNGVAFGHVRLSIIDLTSQANQPFTSQCGNVVITYNGEIYNYKEIKSEISDKYEFKTNSDTEVLIAAYLVYGKEFLQKLIGMFSFVLYDKQKNIILGVRDPYGIKPFYYYLKGSSFVFCSEIKGILKSGFVNAKLNEEVLSDFIVFNRTDHRAETCFAEINNLRPGHLITIELNQFKVDIVKWYNIPAPELCKTSFNIQKENLRKTLFRSVELHLTSDVPVGTALSGGLDSSAIVSMMRAIKPNDTIHSFSAVYDPNWEKDESQYIQAVVKEKNLEPHFVSPNADNIHQDLNELIHQQEEPFASSSLFASWMVYKEAARSKIKVLLNGQGADEIFGYDYMAAFYFKELFVKFKWGKLFTEIRAFKKKQAAHSTRFTLKLFAFLLAPKFLKSKLILFNDKTINKSYFHKYHRGSTFNERFFDTKTLNDSVRNHLTMKLNHLLRVEDKNSMKFGIEGRVPFLEKGLVHQAMETPSKYKVRDGEVKSILKESMKGLLPELVYKRNNKVGYATPMDEWLRSDLLSATIDELLSSKEQPMEKYLSINKVKTLWAEHKEGNKDHSTPIWKYLYLTKWHNIYFNRDYSN